MKRKKKTGVINDPLGQNRSRDHYSQLKIVLFCMILKSDNICENIVITTGREFESAEWIKKKENPKRIVYKGHAFVIFP